MIPVPTVRCETTNLNHCFYWCGSSSSFTFNLESLCFVILHTWSCLLGRLLTATTSVTGREEAQCWEAPGEAISDLLGPAFHLHTFKKGENSQLGGKKKKTIKEKNNCCFESVAQQIEEVAIKHFYFWQENPFRAGNGLLNIKGADQGPEDINKEKRCGGKWGRIWALPSTNWLPPSQGKEDKEKNQYREPWRLWGLLTIIRDAQK